MFPGKLESHLNSVLSDAISIWWALSFPEFSRAAFDLLLHGNCPWDHRQGDFLSGWRHSLLNRNLDFLLWTALRLRKWLSYFNSLEELTNTWAVGFHPQEAQISWIWESISNVFSVQKAGPGHSRNHLHPSSGIPCCHVKATAFSFQLAMELVFAFIYWFDL